MTQRLGALVLLSVVVTGTTALVAARAQATGDQARVSAMTVHEWGTFTSIAGVDGQAVQWQPQIAPTDLPCFVERSPWTYKGIVAGTVRMETPVLYFYSPQPVEVSVDVAFRRGLIT
ncbi:MAG TPA: hypothetical protein VF424_11195, partial [Vicinamibacterales bacterium]